MAAPIPPRVITAKLRKSVGKAVWLWSLFANLAPANWTGEGGACAWIQEGRPISDKELADALDASPKEIVRWRLRLRKCGLLGWHIAPGEGRAFWVNAPKEARQSNAQAATCRDIWRIVQERSIGLTGKLIEDLNPQELLRVASALALPTDSLGKVQ